jgi:hypothetical protein
MASASAETGLVLPGGGARDRARSPEAGGASLSGDLRDLGGRD